MNLTKLVDSLDYSEAKNLAKLLEKKVQKSEQEKAIEGLREAHIAHVQIEFFGQMRYVPEYRVELGRYGHKGSITFELDNGSKIVFDEVM